MNIEAFTGSAPPSPGSHGRNSNPKRSSFTGADQVEDARALMDAALAALPAGVGTLSEMLDPGTGNLLGNYPQGLSHLTLIHAAVTIRDEEGR